MAVDEFDSLFFELIREKLTRILSNGHLLCDGNLPHLMVSTFLSLPQLFVDKDSKATARATFNALVQNLLEFSRDKGELIRVLAEIDLGQIDNVVTVPTEK